MPGPLLDVLYHLALNAIYVRSDADGGRRALIELIGSLSEPAGTIRYVVDRLHADDDPEVRRAIAEYATSRFRDSAASGEILRDVQRSLDVVRCVWDLGSAEEWISRLRVVDRERKRSDTA